MKNFFGIPSAILLAGFILVICGESFGQNYCGYDWFSCQNTNKCIYTDSVCDGIKDCSDGSDENVCFTCPESEQRCICPSEAIYCIPLGEECYDPQYRNSTYYSQKGVTWDNRFNGSYYRSLFI